MRKKVYVLGGGYSHYCNWIIPLGFEFTNNLEEANLCVAEGGADWDNRWYSTEKPHHTVSCHTERDNFEIPLLLKAIKLKVPICGICRGAQIMPYLVDSKKGKIAQHQNHHGFIHPMKTYDGLTIPVSSMHHQAAWPYDLDEKTYKLLGWTENLIEYRFLTADKQELTKPETEVVVYPYTGGGLLGFQMHPECQFGEKKYEKTMKWYSDTLIKFLDGGFK